MDQSQQAVVPKAIEGFLPRRTGWPRERVFAEMQASGVSRRRAKKRLNRRIGSQLRYATMQLPGGGIRLIICTPDKGRSIDLSATERANLARYLVTGQIGQ